jgi:guanylate kinase
VDRFLKGKDKKGVYILSGSYGVGKSQILKYILNKIQKVGPSLYRRGSTGRRT